MTDEMPKKPTKKAAKKTPAAKKAAAKKTAAKKAPAKKVAAKKTAARKVVGPYANNDPSPKQHVDAPKEVEPKPEPAPEVVILEKPSWRSRLTTFFGK